LNADMRGNREQTEQLYT